jgi:hypothetical protein
MRWFICIRAKRGKKRARCYNQGCQMVCFQTKNLNFGKFWRVLLRKTLVYFMTIWSILRPLEIFYVHLVYFVVFWYIFPCFGILDQEKSGNHVLHTSNVEKDLPSIGRTRKWTERRIYCRVARFVSPQLTQTGKNIPNCHKICWMAAKFS